MLSSFEQVFVIGFEGAYASAEVFFSIDNFVFRAFFYLYAALVWQFFVGLSCVVYLFFSVYLLILCVVTCFSFIFLTNLT